MIVVRDVTSLINHHHNNYKLHDSYFHMTAIDEYRYPSIYDGIMVSLHRAVTVSRQNFINIIICDGDGVDDNDDT